MTHLSYMMNTVTADDLAMQEAAALTAMAMTYLSWSIPVSNP